MLQTVAEVLLAADDSVALINGIDDGSIVRSDLTQDEINSMIQQNVDHLEIILAYTDPDVAGSSDDKSSYNNAITTGNAYIAAN
tara:strand:+ start:1538 stop:1789 length:252 start_codon:yes stop_codon:yes gene_type:complete